jgi:large subunit ribosomal protein L13
MKTTYTKEQDVERQFLLYDATDQVLGRLAVKVARSLSGKDKPIFERSVDTGDNVIVVNAAKVRLTGKKEGQKVYYRHSGYPGGLTEIMYKDMLAKHPDRVLRLAVKGMLPRNRVGAQMLRKLKIYAGAEHPHEAQKPVKASV